jgi:MFS family permease
VASLLAGAVAWFAVGETRDFGEAKGGARRQALPSFTTQMRLLTGQIGFVLVSIIALMNAVARTGALFSIVPVLANVRLGLSVAEIGVGLALGSVSGLLVAYPAGMLVDHFGRKAVIVPATAISGLSLLLFCWAPSHLWFIVACGAWGIASSIGGAAPAAYAADSAPPGMNAAAMSTFRLVSDAGYVIGPIALGLLADAVSPDASMIAGATMLIAFGLLFGRLAPETYHRAK